MARGQGRKVAQPFTVGLVTMGWEIDPPWKAYEEWERRMAPVEEEEFDECEYWEQRRLEP